MKGSILLPKNLLSKKILATAVAAGVIALTGCSSSSDNPPPDNPPPASSIPYEIWASDQSNSVAGAAGAGVAGSLIWVWSSDDVETQIAGGAAAMPLSCDGMNTVGGGPCDLNAVFPAALVEDAGTDGTTQSQAVNADAVTGPTGRTLGDSEVAIGRLHGMLSDPQNMYMNVNAFAPGAGYVGIMDARTKEAVALFRVSQAETAAGGALSGTGRSVHMSFWNTDGSAILIANLHGRLLERIDLTRDTAGNITAAVFNRAASLSTQGVNIIDDATAFTGTNAQGNALVSSVSGTYDAGIASDVTPMGNNKIDGVGSGTVVGRPNGVIICPIVTDTGATYITLAGGGAIIADSGDTPMSIIGEYGNDDTVGGLNGVGCGGIQVDTTVWLNAGASAAPGGATQSTFTMYTADNSAFDAHIAADTSAALNTPAATLIFKDTNNTDSGGFTGGTTGASDGSGQVPGTSTRRDGHGMARTMSGSHIHNVDRVQNTVEVFTATGAGGVNAHVGSYDLTSSDGQGNGNGACMTTSVTDGGALPLNDPAPDLMGTTPDGKYLITALRGPAPVTVTHSAQGSCPGVGIITLSADGSSGSLTTVLRTTNTTDDAAAGQVNGVAYTGTERSDPHGAIVRSKVDDGAGGFH